MKKHFLLFVSIWLVAQIKAQTLAEWTQQKKTQIQYLVNQVAALGVYTNTLEKGYAIVEQGVSAIHSIKKGDFNLHQDYFSSLNNVSPKVKSYWKVAEIIALGIKLIQIYHKQIAAIAGNQQFSTEEERYFKIILSNILNTSSDIIDQMSKVITDGSSTMTDDQRISRIDSMYQDMQDQYSFVSHFSSEINLLAMQRMKDQTDVEVTRSLFMQF